MITFDLIEIDHLDWFAARTGAAALKYKVLIIATEREIDESIKKFWILKIISKRFDPESHLVVKITHATPMPTLPSRERDRERYVNVFKKSHCLNRIPVRTYFYFYEVRDTMFGGKFTDFWKMENKRGKEEKEGERGTKRIK